MIKLDDVISKVLSYNPQADIDLIRKAYVYSAKAHEGQMRKSGQPYVVHPLEVANILADMRLDIPSVAAGILHDTIEDTETTKEEIRTLFGETIAELVDGVTKISKLQFHTNEERQAENFRKMILAMSRDIRVILIKLADRLNNMRTLQFMAEEKQMRIAQETLDVYAPLANRMGIDWMRLQLEDLSFRFLKPDVYRQLEKKMARLRGNREQYVARIEKAVREHFGDAIANFTIVGRMKHIYGIYRKMERQNISFEQVHDLIAFRILTETLEQCYEALGLLHSIWKPVPGRFKDYVAMPKANNYQSLHTTVVALEGERVEFQIRTYEMHETAEKGIAAHWKYKEGGQLDMESEQTFQWLHQLMDWQKDVKDSLEFMDTLKLDLFSSDTYVFTPKGDVRALPYGATPIDFAYSIHSDVGNHCAGAKVNGKIVPLNFKLRSGDEVSILTQTARHPTKDWLKLAVSSRAKAHIRQFLKEEQKEKSRILGKGIFEDECRKHKVDPDQLRKLAGFDDILRKKGVANDGNFFAAVAYGKISVPSIISQLGPLVGEEPTDEGIIRKIFKKVSQRNRDLVQVSGLDDILVTFGKCCSPLPGDPIVGFITRGRGVTLHRVECRKVPDIDPERRISAAWNKKTDVVRTAKLRIATENRTGMLANIAQIISDRKVNITKAIVRTTRDEKAIISLDVGVSSLNALQSIMKAVERIKGVIAVEREME